MKQRILFATAECAPFAKVGGLADVAAALPKALKEKNAEVRVIMPLYKKIKEKYRENLQLIRWTMIQMDWRKVYSGLFKLEYQGIIYYFIDNDFYFNFDSIYVNYDFDIERFVFFQKAVVEALGYPMDFSPTILHCNDWQTALIPVLLEAHHKRYGHWLDLKTVFTIHNLKYQGLFDYDRIAKWCELGPEYMNDYGVTINSSPNFIKAAIVYSDYITTVSPSYAEEILNDYYGEGLNGVLHYYRFKLRGIINGLNTDEFNPSSDDSLLAKYSSHNASEIKALHKKYIQEKLGLVIDDEKPLFVLISRLVEQKGIDLLLHVMHELLEIPCQIIVLGTGDAKYEHRLAYLENQYKGKLVSYIAYNNELAHKLYAAADFFLMPSFFEPCGLSQMIAMTYGAIPIVRETGGLKDTVPPYNEYTNEGLGFSFANINAHDFLDCVRRACDFYQNKQGRYLEMQKRCMETDFSFANSADKYLEVYNYLRPL